MTIGGSDASTPLFALYRCQFVVLPVTSIANSKSLPAASNYRNICGNVTGTSWQFYSPNDLANGYASRAFIPYGSLPFATVSAASPAPRASALVLSNVVSFQIQVLKNPNPNPPNPPNPTLGPSVNNDFTDLQLSAGGKNIPFDTANYQGGPPLPAIYGNAPAQVPFETVAGTPTPFSIQALKITLRIWDPKSRFTRQVTVIQDM